MMSTVHVQANFLLATTNKSYIYIYIHVLPYTLSICMEVISAPVPLFLFRSEMQVIFDYPVI